MYQYSKEDERDVALNCRPASLTSRACKILDKLIRRQIEEFLTGTRYEWETIWIQGEKILFDEFAIYL